ncbi:MAG: hypothetical protein E2598_03690 [Sphingobium sp.]|nr:hypothetical protein [Sphingobium sp.]
MPVSQYKSSKSSLLRSLNDGKPILPIDPPPHDNHAIEIMIDEREGLLVSFALSVYKARGAMAVYELPIGPRSEAKAMIISGVVRNQLG